MGSPKGRSAGSRECSQAVYSPIVFSRCWMCPWTKWKPFLQTTCAQSDFLCLLPPLVAFGLECHTLILTYLGYYIYCSLWFSYALLCLFLCVYLSHSPLFKAFYFRVIAVSAIMQIDTKKYYFIIYFKESSHIDFNPLVDISIFFNNNNTMWKIYVFSKLKF